MLSEFSARRNKIIDLIPNKSIIILRTADQFERTFDTFYKFRPRSSFYYLTGIQERDVITVIIKDDSGCKYIIFSKKKTDEGDVWNGIRIGPQEMCLKYNADEAYDIDEIDHIIPELIKNKKNLYYLYTDEFLHKKIFHWMKPAQMKVRRNVSAPDKLIHLESVLQELRLYKSDVEINYLQKAIDITTDALIRAMLFLKPGIYEYEIEAIINHEFIKNNAQSSFPCMINSGVSSCLSHYKEINDRQILNNELVIIDAGAEYGFYTSDLTRTFPANGKFSGCQKTVYELVLLIQNKIINMIKPGVSIGDIEKILPKEITQGLINIGVLTDDIENHLDNETYKQFFMHNYGHWLGLDIHDEASYGFGDSAWRNFKAGMVITVEPGIYIRNQNYINQKWHGIGVRIEDNILVTEKGCRVLSSSLPKSVEEIEFLMNQKSSEGS